MSNVWPLLVVAVGQTFVLTIAGIDLSQGAVMGLTSVVAAMLIATAGRRRCSPTRRSGAASSPSRAGGWPRAPGRRGRHRRDARRRRRSSALGNGAAVARLSMPPFMVTLVTLIAVGAFAIWLTQSKNIRELPESYVALGKGDLVSVYLGAKTESQLPRRQVYSFVTCADGDRARRGGLRASAARTARSSAATSSPSASTARPPRSPACRSPA